MSAFTGLYSVLGGAAFLGILFYLWLCTKQGEKWLRSLG